MYSEKNRNLLRRLNRCISTSLVTGCLVSSARIITLNFPIKDTVLLEKLANYDSPKSGLEINLVVCLIGLVTFKNHLTGVMSEISKSRSLLYFVRAS